MKEVRYFYVPEAAQQHEFPQDEAQHAAKVLRLQPGDEVYLMDGAGAFYLAELTLVTPKHCNYSIKEILPQEKKWQGRVHLAIAPTKNMDRIEWLTEKCTEIGWDELSFLDCKFSERKQIRVDRIEKIVVSAAKQSRKPFMPVVNEMIDFKSFVQRQPSDVRKFICHCYEEVPRKDLYEELTALHATLQLKPKSQHDIVVAVGPEGDFSIDEVRFALDNGFESVTLGDFRLRTETAGLMAVTMAQLSMR